MNKKDYKKLQDFAEALAKKAGALLLDQRDKFIIETHKSDFLDIATTADLSSEEFLLSQIRKRYPSHNIISEENGDQKKSSDFTWFIDPLDGTKEYIRGTPMFNDSITIEYKGEIIVGVSFRPATNELFSCSKGNGSFLNGKKLQVSKEDKLKHSIIWTHLPHFGNSPSEITLTLKTVRELCIKAYRIRAFQEDVAVLSWLALGALEGFFLTVTGPKWWDVAPGILMVKEAGGIVTDTNGSKIKNRDLTKGLVASNGKIHQELLKFFKD